MQRDGSEVYKINLSTTKAPHFPLFGCTQTDTGTRIIEATLYDDAGELFVPSEGAAVEWFSRKADGTGTSHDAVIDGSTVTVTLQGQDLACAGVVIGTIKITEADGDTISMAPFTFKVYEMPMGEDIASSNEYQQLKELTGQAQKAIGQIGDISATLQNTQTITQQAQAAAQAAQAAANALPGVASNSELTNFLGI